MSATSAQGLLQSTVQPLVGTSVSSLTAVAQALGPPMMSFPHSADKARAVETLTLQRILEDKNAYLGFSIVTLMNSANPAMIELFPIKLTNALEHIQDFYEFPKEIAMHTSPGAAPGQSGSVKTQRKWTLTQYNFGQSTTVQELRTTEGQFVWKGKLIILAIAFIEVAEMLVIQALLDTPSYYAEYFVKRGEHEINLNRAGRMKDIFFDCLHRSDNGMAELTNAVRQDMAETSSKTPNILMIAEGVAGLAITKRHMDYYLNGPGAAQNALQIADAFPDVYDGLRIIKVRALDYKEKRLHLNLLEHETQIGQNFSIDFFYPGADLSKWTSNWLRIAVYSMSSDSFEFIGLEEAIDHCGRFHKGDGNLAPHHYALARQWRELAGRAQLPIYDGQVDMFIYRAEDKTTGNTTFNVASIWGHMEPWALSDETIERTVATIKNYYLKTVGLENLNALGVGLDNIFDLYEKDIKDDQGILERAIAAQNGRFNVPELNDAVVGEVGANIKPPGYGSTAGLFAISEASAKLIDQRLVQESKNYRKAALVFHKATEALFGRAHVALNPDFAPQNMKSKIKTQQSQQFQSLINLFHNVVEGGNKLPLVKGNEAERFVANAVLAGLGLPVESPYAVSVREALKIVPSSVFGRLDTEAKANTFAQDFAKSAFAQRYFDGVRRVGRRGAAAGAVDAEGAPAEANVRTFARFAREELQGAKTQVANLLTAVVAVVTLSEPTPELVNADLLNAWRTQTKERLYEADAAVAATPTGLAVSIERVASLQNAPFKFASPYGGTGYLDLAEAAKLTDGGVLNDNVDRLGYHHVNSAARARPDAAKTQTQIVGQMSGAYQKSVGTDIVGKEIVINTVLQERFKNAANKPDWLTRVAMQLFLLAPISAPQLHSFRIHDVAPPVAFLLEQPWRRYRTTSAIFLSKPSNDVLGNILIMDPDMHMGQDAIDKSVFVNMSMYIGAAPRDCQDWYVAHDVAVVGYEGGETATLFDLSTVGKLTARLAHMSMDGPSILPFMVPAGSIAGKSSSIKIDATHDIRGFRSAGYFKASKKESDGQYTKRPQYPSAPYYSTLLDLHSLTTFSPAEWSKFRQPRTLYNTVTHRGLQFVINPHTLTHSSNTMPKDPFGCSVYAGCRDLRMSMLHGHYRTVDYSSTAIPGL